MFELSPQVLSFLLVIAEALSAGLVMSLRSLYVQHKQTREEFLAYKLEVAEKYATKDFISDNFDRLNIRLDKLFDEVHKRK